MGEVLITGGRLIDGTGAAPRAADVLLRNDEIVAVGAPGSVTATATGRDLVSIDAAGGTWQPLPTAGVPVAIRRVERRIAEPGQQ